MDLRLKGKVVLVTGGAKGIGAAIVRGCAREGAVPVLVDKDGEAGKQLQMELQKAGASCGLICTDLLPAGNCASAVERTLRDFGRLDVLVNNAGINDSAGLEHGNPEKFLRSLELNLLHYYNMAHYALPALKGRHHRTGRHLWLRRSKGRNSFAHSGVGCGIASLWHPCERAAPGGSDDSAI